ncbi:hypothetical protein PT277_05130 [Acetobacteraceae bacterium ESL0709]|nr:hypothetical protein [Acetobacteraceae bacterium ESL0697]MDF7678078.1 hypothetical protein [Acetobacteraceae bacterium ESL0709]
MNSSSSALAFTILVTGSLGLLIWYANRAGRNAARVTDEADHAKSAEQALETSRNMAQAQSDRPVDTEALYQRLSQGTA